MVLTDIRAGWAKAAGMSEEAASSAAAKAGRARRLIVGVIICSIPGVAAPLRRPMKQRQRCEIVGYLLAR